MDGTLDSGLRDSDTGAMPIVEMNNGDPPDTPIPPTPDATGACGVCCPDDFACTTPTTVGACRPDGSGFDETPCEDGMICSNGACIPPPVCVPGAKDCLDDATPLLCRQTGEGWVSMTCDTGFRCSQGVCTDKTTLGGGCAADADCATNRCRCGSGTGDNCPAFVGGGLCTDTTCTALSCGMRGRCLASDAAPLGVADFDHCVRTCSAEDPCPTGTKCIGVPVRTSDGVEYVDACYFSGVVALGGECDTAEQCVLGRCLTGYYDTGYCTRRCDDDGACPSGAACVELRPDEFWCTQLCGNGSVTGSDPCPLDDPVDRFDVTCKNQSTFDGAVKRVCSKT